MENIDLQMDTTYLLPIDGSPSLSPTRWRFHRSNSGSSLKMSFWQRLRVAYVRIWNTAVQDFLIAGGSLA
jgi:hypothetical protein